MARNNTDASELARYRHISQQKYKLSAVIAFFCPNEDILNQLYQRRVKGIDPRGMQPLLNPFHR